MTGVCIDGWNLALPHGTGIQVYGYNLLTNLKTMGFETHALYGPMAPRHSSDIVNEAALLDPRSYGRQSPGARRLVTTVMSRFGRSVHRIPVSGRVVWPTNGRPPLAVDNFWAGQDLFSRANRAFSQYRTITPVKFISGTEEAKCPDVMHWTSPLPLRVKGIPNIYTFHDLIPLKLPHTTFDDRGAFYDLSRKIVDIADHITVVSEATKSDLIELVGAKEDRITVTYQSVATPSSTLSDSQEASLLARQLGLVRKNYFLFYGAVEPKKNLRRLVEAYLSADVDTPLVVVGGKGWMSERETALLDQAAKHGIGSNIRRLDYLASDLLQVVIKGAKATLFPSLYEGFGLPVLESMANGVPVMTSTGGALPDIAGDAALKVDPFSVAAIREAIQMLDCDEHLRGKLGRLGQARAGVFSADLYRERLKSVYHSFGISNDG